MSHDLDVAQYSIIFIELLAVMYLHVCADTPIAYSYHLMPSKDCTLSVVCTEEEMGLAHQINPIHPIGNSLTLGLYTL